MIQNSAIWESIALVLTNQFARKTNYFKINVIKIQNKQVYGNRKSQKIICTVLKKCKFKLVASELTGRKLWDSKFTWSCTKLYVA